MVFQALKHDVSLVTPSFSHLYPLHPWQIRVWSCKQRWRSRIDEQVFRNRVATRYREKERGERALSVATVLSKELLGCLLLVGSDRPPPSLDQLLARRHVTEGVARSSRRCQPRSKRPHRYQLDAGRRSPLFFLTATVDHLPPPLTFSVPAPSQRNSPRIYLRCILTLLSGLLAATRSAGVDHATASAIAAAATSPWLDRSGAPRAPRFRASASPQCADAHRLSRFAFTGLVCLPRRLPPPCHHGRSPWSRSVTEPAVGLGALAPPLYRC
jgi:hypothetical protein